MSGSGGVRRGSRLTVLMALAALGLAVGAAVPTTAGATPLRPTAAAQTDTGAISGSVEAGLITIVPVAGATVTATNTSTNVTYGPVGTAPDGTFTLPGLPAGTYNVHFAATNYAPRDQSGVTVTAGQTTTGILGELSGLPGSISGTVTDRVTGQPLAGVTVTVSTLSLGSGVVAHGTTAADGTYTISGLATDNDANAWVYGLVFSRAGYLSQPDQVGVFPNQTTTGIDHALQPGGGTVTGTVTGPDGQPVANVPVEATDNDLNCLAGHNCPAASTDANGDYTLSGMASGSADPWTIQVDPPAPYAAQGAGPFTFTDGQILTVNFSLQVAAPGGISGTVTDPIGGFPIANASVTATNTTSNTVYGPAQTDANGNYTLSNLPIGTYNITASAPGYVSASAFENPVAVSSGQTTTAINVALSPQPGSISGTVTRPDGSPVGGVTVNLVGVNQAASPPQSFVVDTTTTAADGTYTFANVAPDNAPTQGQPVYEVQFVPPSGSGLGPQWWNDRPGGANPSGGGDPIVVAPGQTVTGIDAHLHTASVSGQVTGPSGPVAGATVVVHNYFGFTVGQTTTAADGTWSVGSLGGGVYRVEFRPPPGSGLLGQWWNNEPDAAHSDPIGVTAGATIGNINATLASGPTISGTVTDTAGPVEGATVGVFTVNASNQPGTAVAHTTTAADGTYNIPGLQPGNYDVLFDAPAASTDVGQWFNNSSTAGGATAVTLSAGGTATADAQLTTGQRGSIAGTVTDQSGNPIAGVTAIAIGADGTFAVATTAADGTYTINNVDVGIDTVWFAPPAGYSGSVWNLAAGQLLALTIDQGAAITGIDATLAPSG